MIKEKMPLCLSKTPVISYRSDTGTSRPPKVPSPSQHPRKRETRQYENSNPLSLRTSLLSSPSCITQSKLHRTNAPSPLARANTPPLARARRPLRRTNTSALNRTDRSACLPGAHTPDLGLRRTLQRAGFLDALLDDACWLGGSGSGDGCCWLGRGGLVL